MDLNAEEKLNYLIGAGGKHCAGEEYVWIPPVGSLKDLEKISEKGWKQTLSNMPEEPDPTGVVLVFGKENLVKISMPDEGMYPEILEGDELTIAFREEVREGELAAVAISGTTLPVTVREISYEKDDIWLIPRNQYFSADCCAPDNVMILGKLVSISRDLF